VSKGCSGCGRVCFTAKPGEVVAEVGEGEGDEDGEEEEAMSGLSRDRCPEGGLSSGVIDAAEPPVDGGGGGGGVDPTAAPSIANVPPSLINCAREAYGCCDPG
jgi:hypothetical protein